MRLFLRLAVPALVLVSLTACSEDPVPASSTIAWRVRCELVGGCSRNENHEIRHTDGEDDYDIACTIVENEGMMSIHFRAFLPSEYGIEVRNLNVPASGGAAIGTSCSTTVLEQRERYVGACGGGLPTESQPCRIREVAVDGDTLTGKLLCANLASESDRALQREVTAPGPSSAAGTDVDFVFENCE